MRENSGINFRWNHRQSFGERKTAAKMPEETQGQTLTDALDRLDVSGLDALEQLVNARKFKEIELYKQLFEPPPEGRFSPQTRMNPELLTLSLGSVRTHRALEISSDWCYYSILEVVRAHLPQVECQRTDLYLNTVAFFVHITGRYAGDAGGLGFRNWLLEKVVSIWIKDQAIGKHPRSVNYRTSAVLRDNVDLNTQLVDFMRHCEGAYAGAEVVTGTLLQDSVGEDTLIGLFQKSIKASINATVIDDVAVIRFMVRRIMTGILEQPWIPKSVADAVTES